VQELKMAANATILHAHEQYGQVGLWAFCDPSEADETRKFIVLGTGHIHDIALGDKYIGTIHGGGFVWHIFEVL
jgi:hypothetical protein